MYAKTVEELAIYQIALQLASEIPELVKSIPNNWRIKEVGQILRSSSSVPSNITEGFSQRFYPKQFVRFLNIALGSSDETQSHLKKLRNDGNLNTEIADKYIGKYKNLSVRIVNFINYQIKKHNITP